MFTVPDNFARTIAEVHPEAGPTWLNRLPALLAACAQRWSLTLGPPFAPLSYNYVAPALRADGVPVVLKAGVPCREIETEIAALRWLNGQGIARLLDADAAQGALLLERLEPGTMLWEGWSEARDAEMTVIAASVMRALWKPAPPEPHPFPHVADWARGFQRLHGYFGGATDPLPAALFAEAESLFTDLLASAASSVLLHGDLHHGNILAARHGRWLAIDPKGIVGEPAYEVGALLRNPLPQILDVPDPVRLMARRVDQLADALGFDRARIRGWGMAQCVLSACWMVEDHGHGWEKAIACAELFRDARPRP